MKAIEQQVFEIFANTYPHEAYELNPVKFCDYCRTKNPSLSDKEIKELLEEQP